MVEAYQEAAKGNRIKRGIIMYTWKEKLADWWARVKDRWDLNPGLLRAVLMSAGVTAILLAIMAGIIVTGLKADIRQQGEQFTTDLADASGQLQADNEDFQANVTEQLGLGLADYQTLLQGVQDELAGLQLDLGGWVFADLTAHPGPLPEDWGSYLAHMTSPSGGTYTANVHLHYSPGIGNSTNYTAALDYFYSGINWTTPGVPGYVCNPSFNGTAWGITEVWFNIGTFTLMPGEMVVQPVACVGLNATWMPDQAYMEVFRLGS